jgi:hypothetical protein
MGDGPQVWTFLVGVVGGRGAGKEGFHAKDAKEEGKGAKGRTARFSAAGATNRHAELVSASINTGDGRFSWTVFMDSGSSPE